MDFFFFVSKPAAADLSGHRHYAGHDEKAVLDGHRSLQCQKSPVTTELHLVSSVKEDPSKSMDKEAVLRRIRHHKRLNRVRGAIRAAAAMGGGQVVEMGRFLEDPDDTFSSP
ncbi:hypothetical protein SAY86_023307 [Trapa natans]|uniref:Uncharacterized protein n=1 Tax=Trapa natans TaxID=22666 RepID=A0AAN7R7R1_TRANT|nr:hypothetical protein SAY86_023307 [Trapa natans]